MFPRRGRWESPCRILMAYHPPVSPSPPPPSSARSSGTPRLPWTCPPTSKRTKASSHTETQRCLAGKNSIPSRIFSVLARKDIICDLFLPKWRILSFFRKFCSALFFSSSCNGGNHLKTQSWENRDIFYYLIVNDLNLLKSSHCSYFTVTYRILFANWKKLFLNN